MHASVKNCLGMYIQTHINAKKILILHKTNTLCLRLEMLFKSMHYLGFARVLLSVRRDRARGRVSLSHTNVTAGLVYPECIATLKMGMESNSFHVKGFCMNRFSCDRASGRMHAVNRVVFINISVWKSYRVL